MGTLDIPKNVSQFTGINLSKLDTGLCFLLRSSARVSSFMIPSVIGSTNFGFYPSFFPVST